MITFLSLILLISAPDTPQIETHIEREELNQIKTAEIAIAAAEVEISKSERRSPLLDRLLQAAKTAYGEGRYEDAIGIARRIRVSTTRRGDFDRATTTRPAVPAIDSLYEALERLFAAENQHIDNPLINTAKELIANSEAALEAGLITQADQLARRAILMLSALPPPEVRKENTSETLPLNLNSVSLNKLLTVPEMTPEFAKNIIWFRTNIGLFTSINELRFVPGFEYKFMQIAKNYFTL
ncbi:MAG: hypothetical protein COS94_02365 [Candidatus Hydrogenedentes bacterium CG07_land_8_20_14_0_80_42_17]|nr:MAG: hypothetical protein AUJ18_10525 [Candidatus Hydrogenedentes bacterium CG1_02_42_14]PIU48410.1 MAG: hypothetical protein COS94_02365 [Candidatus Hydrogenedentes bacterium CG07_land_8_20_14_0_80_42_17]